MAMCGGVAVSGCWTGRFVNTEDAGAYAIRVRYLIESFALGALRRGRSIEQFLGAVRESATPGVRWVEVVPVSAGYRVILYTVEDVGGEHFCDLGEFPPLSPGDEEYFGEEVATTVEAPDALAMAEERTGAVQGRWVNHGIAQDEYLDFVRAGRL
jgi:hypothetical protein